MKKTIYICLLLLATTLSVIYLAGCYSNNPSSANYWFSKTSEEFVKYDETTNNLNESGSYWYFTSSKNVDITLSVKINVDNFASYAYLYVNDQQIKSEVNTSIYSYVYKLSLKKGDVIKLHASWVYAISTSEEEFEIITMVIGSDDKQYVIKEYDKTTTE